MSITISAADNFLPLGSRLSMSMELVLEDPNLMPAAVSFQRPPAPAPSTHVTGGPAWGGRGRKWTNLNIKIKLKMYRMIS